MSNETSSDSSTPQTIRVVTAVKATSVRITFETAEVELPPGTKVTPGLPVVVHIPRMASK